MWFRPETTALLVIDVQNDFADPKGSLYVRNAEKILEPLNRLIEASERAGVRIVYTRDWHPAVTPHFKSQGGLWPPHCVQETWGARFHPDLRRAPAADVIRKGVDGEDGYSGFSFRDVRTGERGDTGLDALLRDAGISRVLVAGLATDYCVKETALDALSLGYQTAVLKDATRPVDLQPGDGDRALAEITHRGGMVLDTPAILEQESAYDVAPP